MKSFVTTVVGGAIGLIALYVVGRVAYRAGQETERAQQRYNELRAKTEEAQKERTNDENTDPEETKALTVITDETAPKQKQNRRGLAMKNAEKRLRVMDKLGLIFGIKRFMRKKDSVIGRLVHHPEAHRIEAFVEGDEIRVNVKPKAA